MSLIAFPDRIERLKTAVAAQWRRELFNAGVKVPEAEMQAALDLLLPGVCEYMAAEAELTDRLGRRDLDIIKFPERNGPRKDKVASF
jgi:hypothetical protein